MSLADDLYRETILDHYHHPRNQGTLEKPTIKVEGVNPLCGDEITLYLIVKNGSILDLKLEARGCSINMASGSMMTEAVKGKSIVAARQVTETIKEMMTGKSDDSLLPEELEELESLRGVKKYPVRIKCALLPWNTLLEAFKNVDDCKNNNHKEIC